MRKLGILKILSRSRGHKASNPDTNEKTEKQKLGEAAEQKALEFLTTQGLLLVERNFHCKHGEIDLIMQQTLNAEKYLVFIEVRYRENNKFGGSLASISPAKQRRISASAQYYLQKHRLQNLACRIDVVALTGSDPNTAKLDWIRSAID